MASGVASGVSVCNVCVSCRLCGLYMVMLLLMLMLLLWSGDGRPRAVEADKEQTCDAVLGDIEIALRT